MARARMNLPGCLNQLMYSELKRAVYESALDVEDTSIAIKYIIEKIPQVDIAAETGYERSTVSRRIKRILPKVANTAIKLNLV